MKKLILPLLLSLIFFSCGNNSEATQYSMAEEATYAMDASDDMMEVSDEDNSLSDADRSIDLPQKKIIKDGRIGIKVDELKSSKGKIDSLVTQYKAYYAKETLTNSTYDSYFNLRIRIPNQNYEQFIADIESGTGKILYKEIDARDVTEQYYDIQTRLRNKHTYLTRYRELVKQAKTIKEILEVESHIRVLEEEIESAEGRLRHLSNQVAYSTLDLTLTKENQYKYTPNKRDSFWEKLKEAISGGWYAFVDFILFLLSIWPFWFVIAGGVYLWMRFKKRKTNKDL